MDSHHTTHRKDGDYYKMKLLSGHFLISVTFTIGAVWTIFRLGLNQNNNNNNNNVEGSGAQDKLLFSINKNHNSRQVGDSIISFNRDIRVDSLIVKDILGVDTINHEEISLIAGGGAGAGGEKQLQQPLTGIFLNPDYISMQAKTFAGSNNNRPYEFKIHREVEEFYVHGEVISNVRSIRSLSPIKQRLSAEQKQQHQQHQQIDSKIRKEQNSTTTLLIENLTIQSSISTTDGNGDGDGDLELSGNQGVNLHAQQHLELESKERVSVESREGVIIVRASANEGIRMPNLQRFYNNNNDDHHEHDTQELENNSNNNNDSNSNNNNIYNTQPPAVVVAAAAIEGHPGDYKWRRRRLAYIDDDDEQSRAIYERDNLLTPLGGVLSSAGLGKYQLCIDKSDGLLYKSSSLVADC